MRVPVDASRAAAHRTLNPVPVFQGLFLRFLEMPPDRREVVQREERLVKIETEIDRALDLLARVGLSKAKPRRSSAAVAEAKLRAIATAAEATGLSAKVAKPQSGVSQTRSGPTSAMARRARARTSATGSTLACFWFTTPTPRRTVGGRSFSTARSPARGVHSSRKSAPRRSRSKTASSGR